MQEEDILLSRASGSSQGERVFSLQGNGTKGTTRGMANTAVDDILTTGVVIYVDRHAAEGGHFGRELRKTGIVLSDV